MKCSTYWISWLKLIRFTSVSSMSRQQIEVGKWIIIKNTVLKIAVGIYVWFGYSNKEMGFSTSLQGQASHEALLGRQDAEIKLLETMRRCLTTKVKSDREYASTISSLTLQGKKIERSEDLVGSLIAQVYLITSINHYIH